MKCLKQFVLTSLAAAMVFSLAACGQSGSSNEKTPSSNPVKITKADDLKTLNVAAQRGTIGESLAKDLVEKEEQLSSFEKYVDAITALEQDKVQGVIMDEKPAKKFVAQKTNLNILEEALTEESYAIALKKGNQELLAQINQALKKLKDAGTINAIIEKYNSDTTVDPGSIDLNANATGGQLVMGTEAGFAPYELQVGDGFIGIDVEIMAAIAKELDKTLVIENMNFDALPMAVNSGKIDVAVAGITVTEERQQNMDFSDPYVEEAKQVVVVKK